MDLTDAGTPELRADCGRCAALCCVVLPFVRSVGRAGFAFDKPAGEPCRELRPDDRCGVHDRLSERGMGGCVAYDCLGAGQWVVARHGVEGRAGLGPELLRVEALHELLVLLDQVPTLDPGSAAEAAGLSDAVRRARDAGADPDALRAEVGGLLDRVSRTVRGAGAPSYRHADLAGRDLRDLDLVGADLRGALLIRVDLRGVRLDRTDLLGADLRDADLRGADLSTAFFHTRPQLARARLSD